MADNILIVYASCGRGHENAARALSEEFSVPCHDILDFTHPLAKKIYSSGYRFLIQYCHFLWVVIFEISKFAPLNCVTHFFHRLIFRKFIAYVLKEKPRVVFSTHFFSSSLVSDIKKQIGCRNVVMVTDLGVHPVWIDTRVDVYFVGLECTKEELCAKGISGDKVFVTGFPLREGFYREDDPGSIYKTFSLPRDKPCILFLSVGLRKMRYLPRALRALSDDFFLVVSYGNNQRLKKRLEKLKLPGLKLFSFSEHIWTLMRTAQMIVTKPGGITVFESFQLQKPLVFTHFIWGQEKRNMDVTCRQGVGFYARNAPDLIARIHSVQRDLAAIREKMFPVSNARAIIRKHILDELSSSGS